MFRVYKIPVIFNEERFSEVWIDLHYEKKHGDSVNDDLILSLLAKLSGKPWAAQMESNGFVFFEVDFELREKAYRLIIVVPPDASYLGVRNAYRRKSI
jgi:hypothetical protein